MELSRVGQVVRVESRGINLLTWELGWQVLLVLEARGGSYEIIIVIVRTVETNR